MRNVKIVLLLTACLLLFCGCAKLRTIHHGLSTMMYWKKHVVPEYASTSPRCVHVKHTRSDNTPYNYTVLFTDDYSAYLNDDWQQYYRFDSLSVIHVDGQTQELMIGSSQGNFYNIKHGENIVYPTIYFPFKGCPASSPSWLLFLEKRDSVINGVTYKVIRGYDMNNYSYNDSTGQHDIPDYYMVYYYFNTATRRIDRIIAYPDQQNSRYGFKQEFQIYTEFEVNADSLVGDIFDTLSPRYSNYSLHNDANPPYSWGGNATKTDTLSDTILSYPIVSLTGDTTTILQQEGWVLLDFWIFGCPGCRRQHLAWQRERQNLGSTLLEKEDITILSINPISDNTDLMRREDSIINNDTPVLLHGKGIRRYVALDSYPTYILLSPQKEIVYRTNSLSDYEAILKAKQNHITKSSKQ